MDQTTTLCSVCHKEVLPEYYFCPNCGNKLKQLPLATDLPAQVKVYAHSIVLPLFAFITVTRWNGINYLQSEEPKARQIGYAACALLALSTMFVVWYALDFTKSVLQSATESLNADLGGY